MNNAQRYFDGVAENYQQRSTHSLWMFFRLFERRAISAALGKGDLGVGLDLGCGAGFYSRLLQAKGCEEIVCVDFSASMLTQMRGSSFQRVQANIETVQLDRQFDTIICAGAMEFVCKPSAVFARIGELLAPEGRFILLAPRVSALGRWYQRFHARHEVAVRLFSPRSLRELGRASDLQLSCCRAVFPFSLCAVLRRTDTGARH